MIASEEEARAWLRGVAGGTVDAFEKMELLVRSLAVENQRQNLVSKASLASVWQRHIVDSAQLLTHVSRGTTPWLDLGSGAGLPGLVIAILRPDTEVVLIEKRSRRAEWLNRMLETLDLPCARVIGQSLGVVDTFLSAAITARAFAPLDRLLELSARFSTSRTVWLLPKGRTAAQELMALRGWTHMFHVEPSITDPAAGLIVGTLAGRKGIRR